VSLLFLSPVLLSLPPALPAPEKGMPRESGHPSLPSTKVKRAVEPPPLPFGIQSVSFLHPLIRRATKLISHFKSKIFFCFFSLSFSRPLFFFNHPHESLDLPVSPLEGSHNAPRSNIFERSPAFSLLREPFRSLLNSCVETFLHSCFRKPFAYCRHELSPSFPNESHTGASSLPSFSPKGLQCAHSLYKSRTGAFIFYHKNSSHYARGNQYEASSIAFA